MSGTETVHTGVAAGAAGAPDAGAARGAATPAAPAVPLGADVGPDACATVVGEPPAPAPDVDAAVAPPPGVVNSNKFNCPCGLNHAFTSPPVRLTFPISTACLLKSTCVSCTSSFPNTI